MQMDQWLLIFKLLMLAFKHFLHLLDGFVHCV